MANGATFKPPITYSRLLFLAVFILLLVPVLSFSPSESFLLLNKIHNSGCTIFFKLITCLGDGYCVLAIALLALLAKHKKFAIQIILVYLLSGLLAQIFKNIFHLPRPMSFFQPGEYRYFLTGYTHSGNNSFPSGHTTSAFALAATCIFYLQCRLRQWAIIVAALLVGYSRIYLGQHFLTDVIGGYVLGVGTAAALHYYLHKFIFIKTYFARAYAARRFL